MLFLVEADVNVREYMRDDSESYHHWRLVEANDMEDAKVKTENYFDKTSEYCVYYYVNVTVHETIS